MRFVTSKSLYETTNNWLRGLVEKGYSIHQIAQTDEGIFAIVDEKEEDK